MVIVIRGDSDMICLYVSDIYYGDNLEHLQNCDGDEMMKEWEKFKPYDSDDEFKKNILASLKSIK